MYYFHVENILDEIFICLAIVIFCLPFGFTKAPTIFQEVMPIVLLNILYISV